MLLDLNEWLNLRDVLLFPESLKPKNLKINLNANRLFLLIRPFLLILILL